MLSTAENEFLTRTDRGTPMGELFRRFWLPAFLSSELPESDCPPIRIKLLGEKLVAFRGTTGEVGLLGEHCPHRGASLFFGRNEECGLRCVYHGWKFDLAGRCVEMPNEPAESNFNDKIHHTAYPCVDRGGVVWAYMGPPALQPELPAIEWSLLPAKQRYVSKRLQESNYLQGIEGGLDSSHISFLHSNLHGDRQTQASGTAVSSTVQADKHPHFEVLETAYGLLIGARRNATPDEYYWRVSQFLLPFHQMIPAAKGAPVSGHAWVPIDDESCWAWNMTWHPDRPLGADDIARYRSGNGIHATVDARFRGVANKDNDYLIDREKQRTETFSGIRGIGEQDMACQESMGPIYDRTQEHLGASDAAVIAMRRLLLKLGQQLQAGVEPTAASQPDLYRVRSAAFTIPREQSWVDVIRQEAPALAFR